MEGLTAEELADLDNWDRKRLQRLCKKVGIRANLKTIDLIESLRTHFQAAGASTVNEEEHEKDEVEKEEEEEQEEQQAPKRRRTLSPARDGNSMESDSPSDQAPASPKAKKTKKRREFRTSLAKKRLAKRRKSRRPSLKNRFIVRLINATLADEEAVEEGPEHEADVEGDSDLVFEDLPAGNTEDLSESRADNNVQQNEEDTEMVAAPTSEPQTVTPSVEEGVTAQTAATQPAPATQSSGDEKPTDTQPKSTTRKRKSGALMDDTKEGEEGCDKKKTEPQPVAASTKPVEAKSDAAATRPAKRLRQSTKGAGLPVKLTRTVLLRQMALQKEKRAAAAKPKPREAASTHTSTTTPAKAVSVSRIATPMPPAVARGGAGGVVHKKPDTATPAGKEPLRAKIPGKPVVGLSSSSASIRARPAPNFDAIHQRTFDTMKSIFGTPNDSSNPNSTTTTTATTVQPKTATTAAPQKRSLAWRRSAQLPSTTLASSASSSSTPASNSSTASRKRKAEESSASSKSPLTRTTSCVMPKKSGEEPAKKPTTTTTTLNKATAPSSTQTPKSRPSLFRATSSRLLGKKPTTDDTACKKTNTATILRNKKNNNENERNKGNMSVNV